MEELSILGCVPCGTPEMPRFCMVVRSAYELGVIGGFRGCWIQYGGLHFGLGLGLRG